MFQFTGLTPFRVTEFLPPGCPIRVSVSLCLLAARHGFSQLSAPFFVRIRLGIRPALLVALLFTPFCRQLPSTTRILMCSCFFLCNFQRTFCLLVGLGRLELPTSRLSGVRSNRLSYRPFGDEEIRTPDPLLAKQVLSQLSYAPSQGSLKTKQYISKRAP